MVAIRALALSLVLGASGAAAFDFGNIPNMGNLGNLIPGQSSGGSRNAPVDVGNIGKIVTSAQKSFTEASPAQEAIIGAEAGAVLVGAVRPVNNPKLQRYVNEVGLWVALHTERPDIPWRFGVLDTATVNSFAAPGGYVFITRGMLGQLRNEAELAGVLAHETVHVVDKHYLKAVQKNAGLELALDLVGSTAKANRNQLSMLSNGFKELYARGLDKEDEFDADRKGVIIATRAGYDPYGLPAVLQSLSAMRAGDADLAYLFATHPAPNDRLTRIDDIAPTLDRYADQPVLADRFLSSAGGKR
jgi:predicted Zn-dependent protease